MQSGNFRVALVVDFPRPDLSPAVDFMNRLIIRLMPLFDTKTIELNLASRKVFANKLGLDWAKIKRDFVCQRNYFLWKTGLSFVFGLVVVFCLPFLFCCGGKRKRRRR